MILIQNLDKLLKLSCWKSLIEIPGRSLFCLFLGTYKTNLVFESRVYLTSSELKQGTELRYQIFLPLGIIKGAGTLKDQMIKEDPIYGKVKRLLISAGQTIVSQKRNYKRYFILEKGKYESRGQNIPIAIKDLSMSGIGISAGTRLLSDEGTITFSDISKPFKVKRVYEFTNYNFFEYGFQIGDVDETQKGMLKKKLLSYHQKLQSYGVFH
jgi:hypothetical protein